MKAAFLLAIAGIALVLAMIALQILNMGEDR